MIKKTLTIVWVATFSVASVLLAKLMPPPGPVDMVIRADFIVVAEYTDYKYSQVRVNKYLNTRKGLFLLTQNSM
jgi:hypothetical protein